MGNVISNTPCVSLQMQRIILSVYKKRLHPVRKAKLSYLFALRVVVFACPVHETAQVRLQLSKAAIQHGASTSQRGCRHIYLVLSSTVRGKAHHLGNGDLLRRAYRDGVALGQCLEQGRWDSGYASGV